MLGRTRGVFLKGHRPVQIRHSERRLSVVIQIALPELGVKSLFNDDLMASSKKTQHPRPKSAILGEVFSVMHEQFHN